MVGGKIWMTMTKMTMMKVMIGKMDCRLPHPHSPSNARDKRLGAGNCGLDIRRRIRSMLIKDFESNAEEELPSADEPVEDDAKDCDVDFCASEALP